LNRNTIFYLHLTKQKITSHNPISPKFEGLTLYYLDQLETMLHVLVSAKILPFSESLVDSTSPTAKLATLICGLERITRAIRELFPTRKPYPRRLLGMIRCLSATGSANLGTEIWARAYYSELNIPGFDIKNIPEYLIRHTLERVLLYLADAEHVCFTDLIQFTGVGILCFRIRQLRQTISHHLLFQTSNPTSTPIQKGSLSLVPKFVEHERGFTNLVLLRNAAIDILDQDTSQPSAPKKWSIFLGATFIILGFISSHHTCFIFSLFAAPPDTTHGIMRQTSGWSSIQLAASAGVIGCFCDRARAGTVVAGTFTIPFVLGVILVLISPQTASSTVIISIDAISTNYMISLPVVALLLVSAYEQGFWTTIESTAMLYVIICLLAFAVDRDGMKRQRRDLARIGRKFKERNGDLAGEHALQTNIGRLLWESTGK
jgi:hypothetical protein